MKTDFSRVAHHEAGHAVTDLLLNSALLGSVTIVPDDERVTTSVCSRRELEAPRTPKLIAL